MAAGEFNGEDIVRGRENINWGKGRDNRERSAEREVPGREWSQEQAESAAHSPLRLPNASLTS